MAKAIPGKLLAVTINGQKYRCQTDGSLNITANLSEDDPCKPDDQSTPAEAGWVTRSVDSRDWSMSFSAKSFSDNIQAHNSDVSSLMIDGDLDVEVEFLTTPGQHSFPEDIVYSGSGILANFTLNAPVTGGSTYDVEVSGNGPLTLTRIPATT